MEEERKTPRKERREGGMMVGRRNEGQGKIERRKGRGKERKIGGYECTKCFCTPGLRGRF